MEFKAGPDLKALYLNLILTPYHNWETKDRVWLNQTLASLIHRSSFSKHLNQILMASNLRPEGLALFCQLMRNYFNPSKESKGFLSLLLSPKERK